MSHSVILTQLANSGWTQYPSIARALAKAGIPVPTEAYLRSAFDTSIRLQRYLAICHDTSKATPSLRRLSMARS